MRASNVVDIIERNVTGLHRAVFQATGGRLLGRVGPMHVVALATTGRRTGQRRTTMLTAPLQEGGGFVLVASRGGAPRHPDWYHNLVANPDVEVTHNGAIQPMRARVADAEERSALWPRIVRRYPGYALYQLRTRRNIPVVVVEPRN